MKSSTDGVARRACTRVRAIAAVAITVIVATGLIACDGAASSRDTDIGVTVFPAGERRPLPDITASTLAGRSLDLRGTAGGGILVVNVWASWCTECRSESPALAELATELRGTGVRFVGIDEQDDKGAARSYARSTGMTYPHLVDSDGTVLAKLSLLPSHGIPSTLFVDRTGRMAARIVGAASARQLRSVIGTLNRKR